ncbi:RHO1 GDP-GTP exchange protein 2 [Coemansia sp. RSA 1086]|nr:RHO1 GDP-GTP exchange protein 2 [Coemansia sp. RSA 1086]
MKKRLQFTMALRPTTQIANGTRRHKNTLTSWLKKNSSSELAEAKKLASPAEEIKVVFLRQLKLSSFELDGKQYHSVFTGEQIVDIILEHFKLPDRKLATNVASRLIDCSLYKHVSGLAPAGSGQGAVIDSNAEIYTLTEEAHEILRGLTKGETLHRAKSQTRRRYKDLRSHLHPRGTPSTSRSSTSIQHSHSTMSENGVSSNMERAQSSPPMPMPLAPLDVRRSVTESVASGTFNRWSADSPAETLVAHGPPTAEESANENRRSDGTATPTIPEMDIPTGEFDGLLNTWTCEPDVDSSEDLLPDDGAQENERNGHNSSPGLLDEDNDEQEEEKALSIDGGSIAIAAGESSTSNDSTAGSSGSIQRMSQMSVEWMGAGFGSMRRRGSSIFSEGTGPRRLSLPSIYRPETTDGMYRPEAGSVYQSEAASTYRSEALGEAHSCDEAWLGRMSYVERSRPERVRRHSTGTLAGVVLSESMTSTSICGQSVGAATAKETSRAAYASTASIVSSSDGPAISAASLALSSIPLIPRAPRSVSAGSEIASRRASKGATLRRHRPGESSESARMSVATEASSAESRRVSCTMQLQLWRDSVSAELLQQLDTETVARQEAIYEIIATEQGYLRDLELIDELFVGPLSAGAAGLPVSRAAEFVDKLFFNYKALVANSQALCAQLHERQAQNAVVDTISDIIDEWANNLDDFVEYAVHVPEAQCALEAELLRSEAMGRFLQRAEEAPAARRLPMQSFIGRPATRLARYPLLLDAIARRTPSDSEDCARLHSAAAKVRHALLEIDRRTGDAAAQLRMQQISQRLQLSTGARTSLALDSSTRRLEREGALQAADGSGQVLVFLFDNALVMATEERVPHARGVSRYVADDRIIPISMLDAVPASAARALGGLREALRIQPDSSSRGALAFVHVACSALNRTLVAASETERDAWIRAVHRRVCAPQTLVEAHTDARLLSDRDFGLARAPLCAAPFVSLLSSCQMVLYGTRDGMHMGIYGVPTSVVRVCAAPSVSHIHILRRFNLVVALCDSTLLAFALSEVEKAAAQAASVPGFKLASSVAFFDLGAFMGRPLLVLMKPRGGRSHFKCLQPRAPDDCEDSDAPSAARSVYSSPDVDLRVIGEFAVAGRAKKVHFLRRKLCIVGSRGFDVVDVQQARVLRCLPDPLDDDFSFLHPGAGHALAVCKVGRDFLLCYEACAFFIDNFGRRARLDVFIRWEMRPLVISFRPPYIVAVNARFLEVRHIETGVLLSIIRIPHAMCLNPDSRSTVLHIAVGPDSVGLPADDRDDNAGNSSSAVPVPAAAASRPTSIALLKAPLSPSPGRHIVPGLAGSDGSRSFPESTSGHYRIVEIRLPPLKSSSKSTS